MCGGNISSGGKGSLRRLFRDNTGVTAIEFALLAPAFFALLFSLFEVGLLFTRMAMVDHAVNVVSKQVYTGEVTQGLNSGTINQTDIEHAVCGVAAAVIPNCKSEITVELTEITSMSSLPSDEASCEDATLDLNPTVSFNPGKGNSIVFMRVCMTVDLLTPGLGFGLKLTKTNTGRFELISSAAFLNEPF